MTASINIYTNTFVPVYHLKEFLVSSVKKIVSYNDDLN